MLWYVWSTSNKGDSGTSLNCKSKAASALIVYLEHLSLRTTNVCQNLVAREILYSNIYS